MGLGNRGKQRIQGTETPTVKELFTPTEKAEDSDQTSRIGRPKRLPTKAKTFTLPLELNQRLRRFAFEHECKEVDVVRAALESYLNEHEK